MGSEPEMFVTGSKTFEITDYSIAKNVGNGKGIQSECFTVGGYEWLIEFYPQGISESFSDHVSVFVKLLTFKEVQAMFSIRLRDWTTSKWSTTTPVSTDQTTFSPRHGKATWGHCNFIKRSVLESSNFLKDDTLILKCTLWVGCNRR